MDNRHALVAGISGMGKSNYLESKIFESIWARDRSVVFIDPHGENARHLLDRLPRTDIKRTTYLNFSDYHYPVGFDPLAYGANHALTGLLSIWVKDTNQTPRLKSILRHVLLLLEDNKGNLSDIPRVLTNTAYREIILRRARPYVRRWFNTTFRLYMMDKSSPFTPVLNKIEEITATTLDRFLCQNHPKFDFTAFLNDRGILVVNLAKPMLGDEATAIAGSLITTTLRAAIMLHPTKCDLYADEFPTYAAQLMAPMLSEMRKFGLSITLALQFLDQIEDQQLQKSILANTAQKVYFRLEPQDAALLSKPYRDEQTMTTIASQLQLLPKHECFIDGIHNYPQLFDAQAGKLSDAIKTSRLRFAQQF